MFILLYPLLDCYDNTHTDSCCYQQSEEDTATNQSPVYGS